jgi:chloride channel 3/4/5
MNSYPFLDNKIQVVSDAELGDIVRPVRKSRIIDISDSPFVPATELRSKLQTLLMAGELDSGLPILRHDILSGLIPAPDLEYALDNLEDEENTLCLMGLDTMSVLSDSEDEEVSRVDFGRYIDPVCRGKEKHLTFAYQLTCV